MTIDTGKNYDVIVVGAGHAGCEAALAAARMGCRTLLLTLNVDYLALMPCNPAVGGPGKAHLVREIDALGGEIALNTDKSFVQMRMLNTAKGPAVRALRAQVDKMKYHLEMLKTIQRQEKLDLKQGLAERIIVEDGKIAGITIQTGTSFMARSVVLTTGTYLRGRILLGKLAYQGGPNGQIAPAALTSSLQDLGFHLVRFNTTTPPRVDRKTLDFSKMSMQPGDQETFRFSFLSKKEKQEQLPCWLTYSNERTHELVRENLHLTPVISGEIEGWGPRYCPSFEDKIVRFPQRARHQIFLEPEGWETDEFYVQGLYTALPEYLQLQMLQTILGCEKAEIIRPGYAIEYDCLVPEQIEPSLQTKGVQGLFTAGQLNGSSGYEEAAAQGIIAGINAALYVQEKEPLVLKRSQAYIGVLIDDLVTKGTHEPYRMLTSRAEFRLLLRQDNADLRLTETGRRAGLVTDERYRVLQEKLSLLKEEEDWVSRTSARPITSVQDYLLKKGSSPLKAGTTLKELLKRPEITYDDLLLLSGREQAVASEIAEQVQIQVKFAGYLEKQQAHVAKMEKLENKRIPRNFDYTKIMGLSSEASEKLTNLRPQTLGQGARIPGVSPADISLLMFYLEHQGNQNKDS